MIIHDSMGTSSSKITVDMKSDGLGGSLYGSINSTNLKVNDNKDSHSEESSIAKSLQKSAGISSCSPVGDEFESLPVTIKKGCSIKVKEYEREVQELKGILEEKKNGIEGILSDFMSISLRDQDAAYHFKSNSLESMASKQPINSSNEEAYLQDKNHCNTFDNRHSDRLLANKSSKQLLTGSEAT